MDFIERSYQKHAENFANDLIDSNRIRISQSWFDESTADYWRHARAYECVDYLRDDPLATWLTVGDGRWGLDSIRIKKKGFHQVLPTDISEPLLKAARERGYINEYAVENCEHLSFADASFDYVFCKESFHHFPRPYIALYEMLRVAKRAVFLIEPNDPLGVDITLTPSLPSYTLTFRKAVTYVWRLFKMRIRQKGASLQLATPVEVNKNIFHGEPAWEVAGNYVYGISRRELEKVAYGLDLPQLAIKGLNDHYIQGCEFEPADIERSEIFRTIVDTVNKIDQQCEAEISDYNMLMCGIFKIPMPETVKNKFAANGWLVKDLPRNPHIQREALNER